MGYYLLGGNLLVDKRSWMTYLKKHISLSRTIRGAHFIKTPQCYDPFTSIINIEFRPFLLDTTIISQHWNKILMLSSLRSSTSNYLLTTYLHVIEFNIYIKFKRCMYIRIYIFFCFIQFNRWIFLFLFHPHKIVQYETNIYF